MCSFTFEQLAPVLHYTNSVFISIQFFLQSIHFRYIEGNRGEVPVTLKEFRNVFSSLGEPLPSVECVEARHFANCTTPESEWSEENFGIPTIKDVGYVDWINISTGASIHGGEDEALRHFTDFVEQVWKMILVPLYYMLVPLSGSQIRFYLEII